MLQTNGPRILGCERASDRRTTPQSSQHDDNASPTLFENPENEADLSVAVDCTTRLRRDARVASRRTLGLRSVGNLFHVPSVPHRVELTLVRHGESDWNDQSVIQGQNDTARLTALGRHQARAVAASLRGSSFGRVISSDLVRAKETAAIIAEKLGLELEVEPLLRERCFGVFEGGPSSDLTSENTGIEHEVLVNPEARPAQGESFRDVVVRANRFLQLVDERWPNEPLLVVTHGGMIRALRAQLANTDLKNMEWYPVGNCSVWALAEPEDT